ncbi:MULTISPECIES: type II toxin-antitoxin system VapC family toxin [unclassified Sphingomonas]|uniref:type II toxin-antitoxin system VapC family toxin n=1 Tax=unclassified Sphingomonas TaxID=196159 RepID=UPI0008311343|nr:MULTISPECIES: type II toxin-antitoxin system VapC family toxin [unclassified Sphingomonas]
MKSVDTNVLARFILGDHPEQGQRAVEILREPVWISFSVWLELGWVLSKRLGLDRAIVADMLGTILTIDTVHAPDSAGLSWAIERYRAGADWSDMIHLICADGIADHFVTFDRALAARAGTNAPLRIETVY